MYKRLSPITLGLILFLFGFVLGIWQRQDQSQLEQEALLAKVSPLQTLQTPKENLTKATPWYGVVRVVDGDTLDVDMNGKIERIRLIGINTPETVDPRKPVECFGKEASEKAKQILTGEKVTLENESSQGERDKYGRLLRYVFLEDGTNFSMMMIQDGYAYEYTYDLPYKYQTEFKQAQNYASERKLGLWSEKCEGQTSAIVTPISNTSNSCNIKGNINAKKEKIYHLPGCGSYDKTVINESDGEKWFCSEQDALDAGWRKALNC